MTLLSRKDFPANNFQELLAYVKTNQDKVSLANAGIGAVSQLCGMLFSHQIGVKLTTVPYKGAGPAMTDLLGGQVAGYFGSAPSVMSQLQPGKIRALCVTSTKRLPTLANVPTVAEQGYPGFDAVTWLGIVGPAGMPADVVARINQETLKILDRADVKERLAFEGSVQTPGTPQQFAQLIQNEIDKWGALVREAKIKLE